MGALALILTTSCGGSQCGNSANDSCVINNDSLAIAIGAGMGSGIANQFNQIPDSIKAKISKEAAVKSVEYILDLDTADNGYMAGIQMGMQLAGQIQYMEQMGAKVDRELVAKEFKK